MAMIQPKSDTQSVPSPPFVVPFTVSLLISETLFPDFYSPAATLIIPFIRVNIPYGYVIIIVADLITALLVKWSYGSSYSLLAPQSHTALPDLRAFGQVPTNNSEESTPLLPQGMAFNLSISSPFFSPESPVATLYTLEIKQVPNVPGYVVPIATLLLYLVLKPYFDRKGKSTS